RPSPARSTSGRRRWRRPTRKASRSANQPSGLKSYMERRGLPRRSLFLPIRPPMRTRPALRTELLFYLSFFAAAALLVGVATTMGATSVVPAQEFWVGMGLVAPEVGDFMVFWCVLA